MAEPDGVTSSNMNGSQMTTESTPIDTHYTSSGSSPPTIEAAIDLARRFRVVPLNPRLKSPWLEYCTTGYKDRPAPTEYEIRGWFDVNPNLNIGIHMGHGLIALDMDEKPGKMSGSEALARLEELHGPLPLTLTSITGSGGQHVSSGFLRAMTSETRCP